MLTFFIVQNLVYTSKNHFTCFQMSMNKKFVIPKSSHSGIPSGILRLATIHMRDTNTASTSTELSRIIHNTAWDVFKLHAEGNGTKLKSHESNMRMENTSPIVYVWKNNTLLKLVCMRGARKTDCSLGHQHAQIKQLNIQINPISQKKISQASSKSCSEQTKQKRNRWCLKNEQNVCLGFTSLDPCQATLDIRKWDSGTLKPRTERYCSNIFTVIIWSLPSRFAHANLIYQNEFRKK